MLCLQLRMIRGKFFVGITELLISRLELQQSLLLFLLAAEHGGGVSLRFCKEVLFAGPNPLRACAMRSAEVILT